MPAAKKSSTTRTTAANNSGKRKTVQPANSANQISRVSDGEVKKHRAESTPSGMPFSADWREPKEYPPPDCIDMAWLAWEFLRRNNNYAQHVQQMLALPSIEFEKGLTARGNASLDGMVCTPPAKPGENVKQFRRRVATETSGKTKVKIEKPQLTFINQWMLEQPVPVEHPYDPDVIQFVPNVVKVYRHQEPIGRRVRLMMYANEMAVRYRLDLPLQVQLKKAKQMLGRAVKRFDDVAKQSTNGKKDHGLVSNAKSRNKDSVGLDAHFWLRAFDAGNQPKLLLDDTNKKRKRAQQSGPSEIAKRFLAEGCTKTFERGVVEGYQSSAERMIDKLGYQKLVIVMEAAPKISLGKVWSRKTAKST